MYVNIHHMKRTTVYLEPELEVLLKLEVLRQKRPMAELVREALHAYVRREPKRVPPGAGAFASGHTDTAERAEELLGEGGFGGLTRPAARRPRPATSPRRTRS
jgi:hypothetical protein